MRDRAAEVKEIDDLLASHEALRARSQVPDLSDCQEALTDLAVRMGDALLRLSPSEGQTLLTAARSLIDHGQWPHLCVPALSSMLGDLKRELDVGNDGDAKPPSPQVDLLRGMLIALAQWRSPGTWGDVRHLRAKERINANVVAARQLLKLAGVSTEIEVASASRGRGGGAEARFADAFDHLFYTHGLPGEPTAAQRLGDAVQQALGWYAQVASESPVVRSLSTASFDIEGAIVRALRLAFQAGEPAREQDVQDAVEVILRSIAVDYTREQDTAPVGARRFTPDFVVAAEDLALEVKLATEKHRASAIQEEIAADVAGYSTRWKRALFVIYDLGVIDDPERLRQENMRKLGVTLLIIKH